MLALSAGRATAGDWGGFLALTSDYVYRGASQTSREPAPQADLHYLDPDGWIAGLWASSVRIRPEKATGAELDPYLGYAWAIDADFTTRFSALYHAYAGGNPGAHYDYAELSSTLAYRSTWFCTATVSPDTTVDLGDYQQTRRVALSLDLAWHRPLAFGLSTNIGAGLYRLQRPSGSSYGYGSAGLAFEHGRLRADLALIAVTGSARDYLGGGQAANHLVGTVLWRY